MYAQVEKPKENKSRAVANSVVQKKSNVKQGFGFVDNRSEGFAVNIIQCATVMADDGKLKRVKKNGLLKFDSKSEKIKKQRLTNVSKEVMNEIIKKKYDPGPEVQCSKVGRTLYIAINTAYPAPRNPNDSRGSVSENPLISADKNDDILEEAVKNTLEKLKLKKWVDKIIPIAKTSKDKKDVRYSEGGKQHAESRIINELLRTKQGSKDLEKHNSKTHVTRDKGMRVLRIGGTKPQCVHCEDAFEGTGDHLEEGSSYKDLIKGKKLALVPVIPEGVGQDTDTSTNWEDALHKRKKK